MDWWSELRQWVQFFVVSVGGVIALLAYLQNLKQRRVENALKFVQLFRESLSPNDMANWNILFHSTSEPSGAKFGHYIEEYTHQQRPLADYFSEGAPDGHSIARMADSLNVVCHQVNENVADPQIVYYELGQLIDSMHGWLSSIPESLTNGLLIDNYSAIHRFQNKYRVKLQFGPRRVQSYIE